MPGAVLMQWSTLQFEVYPLNFHELEHHTATDWARKEIAGAAIYREWVGENDEELFLRGRVFPYRLGGMAELDIMEACRRKGLAGYMVRGNGDVLGWFVLEKLSRVHQFISVQGIGKQINFEAVFERVPTPDGSDEFPALWGTAVGG